MDGRRFVKSLFASEKALSITQVVMNLPNDATEFLGMLFTVLKVMGKGFHTMQTCFWSISVIFINPYISNRCI